MSALALRRIFSSASSRSILTQPHVRHAASEASAATSRSLPKIAEKIINITAIDKDGDRHLVKGLEGQSLLTTLIRNGLEIRERHQSEEIASCNGNCEVTIANEWLTHIPPPTDLEINNLKSVSPKGQVNVHSRLGCQVILSKKLDGMTVAMVEERPYYTLNLTGTTFWAVSELEKMLGRPTEL